MAGPLDVAVPFGDEVVPWADPMAVPLDEVVPLAVLKGVAGASAAIAFDPQRQHFGLARRLCSLRLA